ncbi:hypothetical protein [Pelagicoccus mobilis]|uniref:Periplasmic heavy metal sensor n=1 Tax=Pelagicoccus mobilis TaxID=415221 RepID=A0A934VSP0_9BACT|nr:hypothetical protein [Pelagicoccus mobilis]MBK1878704.1 hypothetical protein [Pelagicoccus mobilis]
MKPKSRSVLILASTLLVGMLLGALVHAQFFEKRVKRMHRMSTPEGFVESYLRTIQPVDTEQEAAIRAVLEPQATSVIDSFKVHREALHAKLDGMRAKLDPLLTDDQKERLDERRKRGPGRRVEKE